MVTLPLSFAFEAGGKVSGRFGENRLIQLPYLSFDDSGGSLWLQPIQISPDEGLWHPIG